MSTIRNGQNNWIGHVLRGNSLMKIALEGRMVGKKTVDRPRVMLFSSAVATTDTRIWYAAIASTYAPKIAFQAWLQQATN